MVALRRCLRVVCLVYGFVALVVGVDLRDTILFIS